jgi:phosphoglycerol transferase MdoB-like AlkP superfamily enzyme
MKNCVMCGDTVTLKAEDGDLMCPNCGWGQRAALRLQMEKLKGYNKTFYPRAGRLALLYLVGLPLSFFLLWLTVPKEASNAAFLSQYGKATTATVVETKYGYSRARSRRSTERIPIYFNYIVYDGHRDAVTTEGQPHQIGEAFEIIYYLENPKIFSLSAKKVDSSISILFRDISFLGLFALAFFLALSIVIVCYTWKTIRQLRKYSKLKIELDHLDQQRI